ncbi:MAG: hypothetical protein JKX76_00690 [Colwellia sp.]|nr:hypothetical protein [Colwellia sp.]
MLPRNIQPSRNSYKWLSSILQEWSTSQKDQLAKPDGNGAIAGVNDYQIYYENGQLHKKAWDLQS